MDRNVILLSLHESAMYSTYDANDFRPPYILHPKSRNTKVLHVEDYSNINAKAQLISSAYSLAHGFAKVSVQHLQTLPAIAYTKLVYALVIILKLVIFSSETTETIQQHLHKHGLQDILSRLLDNLAAAAGEDRQCIVPAIFYRVLLRIRQWFDTAPNADVENDMGILRPLSSLCLDDDGERDSIDLSLQAALSSTVTPVPWQMSYVGYSSIGHFE